MSLEFIKPTYSAVKSVNGKTGTVEITAETLGAATVDYVNKTVKEAQLGGEVNLDDYATKDYVDYVILEVPETTILQNYYTKAEAEVKCRRYVDEQIDALPKVPDMTEYAKKTDIPAVPNAVSGLENDVGYQTAAQVEAAISTALGNIGVAEEGAY